MTDAEKREKRRIDLMRRRIAEFRAGQIVLRRLVDDLYGSLAALELTDERWREEFESSWIYLEIALAKASSPHPVAADLQEPLFEMESLLNQHPLGDGSSE